MKRNLGLFLIMTAAAFAQSPTVLEKPTARVSNANVKVVPQTATQSAKPSPTVKVSPARAQKPAVVSVPAAGKTGSAAPAKASPPSALVKVSAPTAQKPATVGVQPAGKASSSSAAKAGSPFKPVAVPVTSVTAPKTGPVTAKAVASPAKVTATKVTAVPAVPAKASVKAHGKPTKVAAQAPTPATVAVQGSKPENDKPAPKMINAVGRRDPFVSPVIAMGAIGSGCSSGKRCLAIDQVALKGVVKSDTGMIAVVVNALDKAYFLRENDPVFNGYVLKITGDSIVFKETFHDKLGKPLTRDVTKTINRPVA